MGLYGDFAGVPDCPGVKAAAGTDVEDSVGAAGCGCGTDTVCELEGYNLTEKKKKLKNTQYNITVL